MFCSSGTLIQAITMGNICAPSRFTTAQKSPIADATGLFVLDASLNCLEQYHLADGYSVAYLHADQIGASAYTGGAHLSQLLAGCF